MARYNMHETQTFGSRDYDIDVNLTSHELTALKIAIDNRLAEFGIKMTHDSVTRGEAPHPGSHLGALVSLRARIDRIKHGRPDYAHRRDAVRAR